ncbi:proteasome maturation protein-like [Diadema antillarum]|uniref:proteasome maturation protein-like n=1 Tax=Diadema antillarum TaxID=105358 RepID=UPI003A892EDF
MAANMDVSGTTEITLDKKNYGVPDLLAEGPTSVKQELVTSHPLEKSEKNFWKNHQEQEFANLRTVQGMHAPLRLMMERSILAQSESPDVLPSSNALSDSLTGRDCEIGFEDVLNVPGNSEAMGNPHAMYERKMGIL